MSSQPLKGCSGWTTPQAKRAKVSDKAPKLKKSELEMETALLLVGSDDDEHNDEKVSLSQQSTGSSNFATKIESDEEIEAPKSKRGKALPWMKEFEFGSKEEYLASDFLANLQDNFNAHTKKVNKQGEITRVWVCKFSKMKSGFDCPVKFRTIQTGSMMMTYKQENVDHKHDRVEDIQRKNFNFSVEVEAKMLEMLEMNVNSRNMRKHLIGKGYYTEADAPSDQAFYSKTNKLRKKLNLDRITIGLREFEDLILEYSVEPENPDEPYIVKSIKPVEDKTGKLRYSVMFSTKNLIEKHLKPGKPWLLSLDATYQTNTENCPLIFFGSSSKDGKFHGVGAILSSREDKEAYDFLFEFVREVSAPNPTAIMADAAKAITSSARDILPDAIRLFCFFHVMKNVKERLAKLKKSNGDMYKNLIDDIQDLQAYAIDQESFLVLYSLLKKKWLEEHVWTDSKLEEMMNDFFEYFTKIWVDSEEFKWFQASNPQHATTNNNVAGTNNIFKKEYTGRTRLSLPNLFTKLKDLVGNWNNQEAVMFNPEKVPLNLLQMAEDLMEKCAAEKLLLSKPSQPHHRNLVKHNSGVVRGLVKETNIVPRLNAQFEMTKSEFGILGQKIHSRRSRITYESFDEFKNDSKSIAMVETVFDDQDDSFFSCSCEDTFLPSGCKGKVCVHVVIALIKAGKITVRAKDRRISNYHHSKGQAKRNRKQ